MNNSGLSQAEQIRRVEAVVAATKLDSRLLELIDAAHKKSGRPRQISMRAFLVALLVVGMDGREHLVRVARFLNSLDVRTRTRLGVARSTPVTRRQVERMNQVIVAALEKAAAREGRTKWEMLDEIADLLLPATAHADVRKSSAVAVDGTAVDSWGTRRRHYVLGKDGSYAKRMVASDPDAKWRGKSPNSWKRPFFGYDLTAAVSVPDLNGPDVPLAVLAMRFRPANTTPVEMGLAAVTAAATFHGRIGDVLVDREYTKRVDGADFLMPVRALGGEPVFDLTEVQRGGTGTVRGAVVVDGQLYSPAMPRSLYEIAVPAVNASRDDLLEYQRQIALREKFALVAHGSRKADGRQVYICPAATGKVKCPLMSPKKPLKGRVLKTYSHPQTAGAGSVCANSYTTFGATDAPLAQREQYGSKEWYWSYMRRNLVEGFFGNVKNQAAENLSRGSIRVRGGMKTGLFTLMIVAATNLRLAERWDLRQPRPTPKKRGRPAKQQLASYAEVALRAGRTNAPPAA